MLPTLEDVATLMRLLPRSATGPADLQLLLGADRPAPRGELDGPEHMYYVLVDAGRTGLLGGEFQEMLRCIRCGACMNHCPVYQKIGGHAYGWVYPGPMGSVLTPSYVGVENALDLPQAATLVQPVQRRLSGQDSAARPAAQAAREAMGARPASVVREGRRRRCGRMRPMRPSLYAFGSKVAVRVLRWMGGSDRRIRSLPVGARLDRQSRLSGAERPHVPRDVSRAPSWAVRPGSTRK